MKQESDITQSQNTSIPLDAGVISGRYLCDILEDMRNCHKTRNYSYIDALIGELQYRANRMEDRLHRIQDIVYFEKSRDELKDEITELEKKKKELQKEMKTKDEKEDKDILEKLRKYINKEYQRYEQYALESTITIKNLLSLFYRMREIINNDI